MSRNPNRCGHRNPRWKGGRVEINGYVAVLPDDPDHPRANVCGTYVMEHVLVAERALGRPIPATAHVHHVNGDKSDNRPANLVICEDTAYHNLLHARQKALEEAGDPNYRKCKFCGEYDDPDAMYINPASRSAEHLACKSAYQRAAVRAKAEAVPAINGVAIRHRSGSWYNVVRADSGEVLDYKQGLTAAKARQNELAILVHYGLRAAPEGS